MKALSISPIVVWVTRSSSAAIEKQIGACINELGAKRVFISIIPFRGDAKISDEVGGLHPYVFPESGESSLAAHSIASETKFWQVINELAFDISLVWNEENNGDPKPSIFLAPVPESIEPIARKLRHDLVSRGFEIRPKISSGHIENIESHIAGSRLSVHLFGQSSAAFAERGAQQPMDVFRAALSFARTHPEFRVLGWTDAQASDATTSSILSDQILRESKEFSLAAEVIQSTIEDFKSLLYDRLSQSKSESATMFSASAVAMKEAERLQEISLATTGAQLYVIYDQRDAEAAGPVTTFLQNQGIGVLLPEFPTEQNQLRAVHNENLRRCDGVLIVYGAVQEQWVRMKQQDLLRAAALGRQKSLAAKGVFLCSNKTEGKLRFSAPDMMIINGFESTANLAPFIQRLSAA